MTDLSRRRFLELAAVSAVPHAFGLGVDRLSFDWSASHLVSALADAHSAPWHAIRAVVLSGRVGPARWGQWASTGPLHEAKEMDAIAVRLAALLFAADAHDLVSATAISDRGRGLLLSARYNDGLGVTLAIGPALRLPETPIIRCTRGSIEPIDGTIRIVEEIPAASMTSTASTPFTGCGQDAALLDAARLACATLTRVARTLRG
ncbi:MAG TPA: hypothetical protein PLO37_09595 [Candidatus Hydrogenedentes bacterium]|nr:hypothetical protein [Candidatus Hydrogenedentota bacterium]HPG67085.1 hypothetical protein [Candidatus Hydrogenedentota bacterium]